MDKFDIEANTGEIEIFSHFGQLPCDKKVTEKLSLCQAQDA
jgi:hypothetical protein